MSELALIQQTVDRQPELVMPSGVLVDLRNPTQVADALDEVSELKHRLDELRSLLTDVIRLEAHRQGTKTLHLDGIDAVVSGGERTDYDALKLQLCLREAGLPEDRISAAVVETVSYKPDGRVLRQLAGANPLYADIIAACKTSAPAPWRVTTKRVMRDR
jgi:hypothetical protein